MNPSVVYRGLPMACGNLGGTTACQFYFVGTIQNLMKGSEGGPLSDTQVMLSALAGGICSGVPGSVWELTMIQQQNHGGTLFGTPTKILADYGMAGIFRGCTTTLAREGLFTMAMLGMTPTLQREFKERLGLSSNMALAAGALSSSCFAATLTHPLDTIKTCMQGDMPRAKFGTVTETGKTIIAEHGMVNGLFKGLGLRIGLISTTFFLVNQFKSVIAPTMFGLE